MKDTVIVLLIAFGNMLILVLGVGQIFLMSFGILAPLAIIALFILHTIAVKLSRKRCQRRFGITSKQYILMGVLPAAAISVLVFILTNVLMMFGIREFLLWSIDSIPIEWIFSMFASGYSVLFLAVQSALAAREVH
ncbi:MAG: hypothetical protein HDT43_08700 [Ruminococcaceae bacterium]|nr:hypothetical protein [Oscillospiraceae bacterium]